MGTLQDTCPRKVRGLMNGTDMLTLYTDAYLLLSADDQMNRLESRGAPGRTDRSFGAYKVRLVGHSRLLFNSQL